MITQRAKGVLKLRSEPLPQEREENSGLQLPSVTLGLCSYQCLIFLKSCIVFTFCMWAYRGRATRQEFKLYFTQCGNFFQTRRRYIFLQDYLILSWLPCVQPWLNQRISDWTVVLHYTSIMLKAHPKCKANKNTERGVGELPQSSFGLGRFPQVVWLISCFTALDRRAQSLSV